jgi:hypothetical protein
MTEWMDLRRKAPWLGRKPFWVSGNDGDRLRSVLQTLGFATFETSGIRPAHEGAFLLDLVEAMDLAPGGETNWDAFNDAFGDLVRHTPVPIALIWVEPALAFADDLAFGLALFAGLSDILGQWNRLGPDCHQVELFLEGRRHPT